MNPSRSPALLLLAALAGCGAAETPQAAPGAVERTTAALTRNEAVERGETIRRIDAEAEARAAASKERIEAIERGQALRE